jgi:hypothetical protein
MGAELSVRLLALLLLALACGGATEEPEAFGWCCEGLCGLAPEDAAAFDQCTCDGIVRPVPGTRGACVDPAEPWR